MTNARLREATRLIAATARHHLGPHPPPAELIAYHAGELSAADEARLQAHFALCPECTAAVLDLASFPRIELRPGATEPLAEMLPDWQSVRASWQESEVEPPARSAGRPPARRERLVLALAAGLFLALLGMSYRLHVVERRSPEAELARGDLPLFTLTAEGASRSRGEERLSISGDRFSLMLFLANPGSYRKYSLAAFSARDKTVVWRLDRLQPTSAGTFLVVGLSRRELPPGSYTLRLYGDEVAGPKLLAEYSLSIEYS